MKSVPRGWHATLFLPAILFITGCDRPDRLTAPAGTPAFQIFPGDPSFAYVVNQGSDNVSVIATATNTVVATVGVGSLPLAVAITPDGAFAYVTNQNSNTVSVIATATNTVAATVELTNFPVSVAITPDGAFAYVVTANENTVAVIATATNTVVATVGLGSIPNDVAMTPDGAFAYVTNGSSNTVSVIATATNTVVATVGVGTNPVSVAITPNPGTIAVAIDIKPGSDPNSIKLGSKGTIPVAILSVLQREPGGCEHGRAARPRVPLQDSADGVPGRRHGGDSQGRDRRGNTDRGPRRGAGCQLIAPICR